jgi:integrase
MGAIRIPDNLPYHQLWHWKRNRRAIYLMLYTGLRLSEAAVLLWEDVDLHAEVLTVEEGKGGKARLLPIHPALWAKLDQVPRWAREPAGAVAGKQDGERLNPKALAHIFEVWLPKRGIKGVHAHRLRHTFATEMLKVGVPLPDIQEAMGHTDISTTRIYLRVDFSRLRGAVERLPTWE